MLNSLLLGPFQKKPGTPRFGKSFNPDPLGETLCAQAWMPENQLQGVGLPDDLGFRV